MINRMLKKYYSKYETCTIKDSQYIKKYYNIEDKYIFVPYSIEPSILEGSVDENIEIKPNLFELVSEISEEIAVMIQSKLPKLSYLRLDIYLFIFIDKYKSDIKNEEILRIENDKFCCRKIIFDYEDSINRYCIEEQFKRKFLFNKLIEEECLDNDELYNEQEAVKKLIIDDDGNKIIDLERDNFIYMKNYIKSLYQKYGVE